MGFLKYDIETISGHYKIRELTCLQQLYSHRFTIKSMIFCTVHLKIIYELWL